MIQVLYVSSATHPMSPEQLIALLEQSRDNNIRIGVTGMLLYANATFLQVLEGEEQVIDQLCDKIRTDARHTNVQFLHRGSIAHRGYSDWSMGFKRISGMALQKIEGLRDIGERDFNPAYLVEHKDVVENLMEHFRVPGWDPLIRELNAQEKVIKHLQKSLAHAKGCA